MEERVVVSSMSGNLTCVINLLLGMAAVIVARAVLFGGATRSKRVHRMHLVDDGMGNESLVVDTIVAGRNMLFLLDTAYAGAPVLSASYLAHLDEEGDPYGRSFLGPWPSNVRKRYLRAMRRLSEPVSDEQLFDALDRLYQRSGCRSYTSGCTMRLMGIGETSESNADMFLCPPIRIDGKAPREWDADVLVTNSLRGSVNILTNDYLAHHSPCMILISSGKLVLGASPLHRHRFRELPSTLVGGAYMVPMTVAGVTLQIVIDTGACATLSLSKSVLSKLDTCVRRDTPLRRILQMGVNGERICSTLLTMPVECAGVRVPDLEVCINSSDVESSDGYAGMGFLRMFDMYVTPTTIAFRRNHLTHTPIRGSTEGSCDNLTIPSC